PNWPHPIRFIGIAIKKYEKIVRSVKWLDLKLGGYVLMASTITTVLALSSFILYIAGLVHPFIRTALEIYLIYSLLAAKCLDVEAMKVYKALESDDITKGRQLLSYLVGRDTSQLRNE